mmetsp:Transcript_47870/g.154368  ORF Transcript_47870/g.154368 Transcript_47870/m.154368 type:complete len:250 (-) Transcript_47870:650-1399(-)
MQRPESARRCGRCAKQTGARTLRARRPQASCKRPERQREAPDRHQSHRKAPANPRGYKSVAATGAVQDRWPPCRAPAGRPRPRPAGLARPRLRSRHSLWTMTVLAAARCGSPSQPSPAADLQTTRCWRPPAADPRRGWPPRPPPPGHQSRAPAAAPPTAMASTTTTRASEGNPRQRARRACPPRGGATGRCRPRPCPEAPARAPPRLRSAAAPDPPRHCRRRCRLRPPGCWRQAARAAGTGEGHPCPSC